MAEAKAVFLDRDGVVNLPIVRNGKPFPPLNVQQTQILPDALPSLTRLKQRGFLLIVVTNQPDVRRGATTHEAVKQIHGFLAQRLPIDGFFTCFHDDGDHCDCRKPLPGLLLQAALKHDIDIKKSYVIGDRWRDIDAGFAAGCRTVLIDYGYDERKPANPAEAIVQSLSAAVDWVLRQEG